MQPGYGQQMREIGDSQRCQRVLSDARAVTGHDGRGQTTRLSGECRLDMCRQRHARLEQPLPPIRRGERQNRAAGIAHGAELLKPCVTLKIETTRLYRAARW